MSKENDYGEVVNPYDLGSVGSAIVEDGENIIPPQEINPYDLSQIARANRIRQALGQKKKKNQT